MGRTVVRNVLVIITWLIVVTLQTQGQTTVKSRPKIGLALAGGAARGLAHVGVFEWFEKHHIPIDCVAGSSMGGIIGGYYATGMNAKEMRETLEAFDFNTTLSGETPYDALNFRRKEDRRNIPNRIEIGLKNGVKLPSGLDPGHPIGLLYSQIALPYSTLKSFDDLPTPFRCVATDLESGKSVILRDGSLATALRATVAIPAVFTPAEREGKLLADGGLLNNMPTEAVKEMGADIIIAVDISGSLSDKKNLQSLVEVLGQSVAIMVLANVQRSLQLADIVLAPNLDNLAPDNYDAARTFAARGFDAAEKKSALLSKLALPEDEWRAFLAQRQARRRTAEFTPTFLEVTGVRRSGVRTIETTLRSYLGVPLNVTKLEKELTNLTGVGRYDSLAYEKTERDGKQGLLIRVREKSYGPPFANIGMEINGADTDNITFNVAARLTNYDLLRYGAELRTDVRIGTPVQFSTEYYQRLGKIGKSKWFVAPRLFYNENKQALFQGNSRVAQYKTKQLGVGFDLGKSIDRRSELRIGAQYGYFEGAVNTGSPLLPSARGPVSLIGARYAYDGQDSPTIPQSGQRILAQAQWFFESPAASKGFARVEGSYSSFHPLTSRSSLFGAVYGGSGLGTTISVPFQFTLGGPLRLGAYNQNEFRGNNYYQLSAGYLYRIARLPSALGGRVLLGGWYEWGSAFSGLSNSHPLSSLSVGLMADTLLGPIVIGGSFGERNRGNLYFSLGRLF